MGTDKSNCSSVSSRRQYQNHTTTPVVILDQHVDQNVNQTYSPEFIPEVMSDVLDNYLDRRSHT